MSNAERLRSGHGLPMSDRLVDIGPVEQQAPSTSSQPSLAHPGQWIRSDTRRYTQQGAARRVLNFVSPTALAPPTLKSDNVPTQEQRTVNINHRLQNPPLHRGGAPHRAPPSVRTFMSAANSLQTQASYGLVVCRQHTQPTRNHITTYQNSKSLNESQAAIMSSSFDLLPTYRHVLLRDRPEHATYADLSNPKTRLARHPLAPFLMVPQPPPNKQNLGTTMDPSPGRGLQTPLVLAPARSTYDLGPADDLSSRMIDSYLLTCQYSTPPHLASFLPHGMFLLDSPHPTESATSACSVARRWLLESVN
jgi:hypothetical protein